MSEKLQVVRDEFYARDMFGYIELSNVEKINIGDLEAVIGQEDDYYYVIDSFTGFKIGASQDKSNAIKLANNNINESRDSVLEAISKLPPSPRYSKDSLTQEEEIYAKTKKLYEDKELKKLYEIVSNVGNQTSRKALSSLLGKNINGYVSAQMKDLFVSLGYDPYKAEQEAKDAEKKKEQAKKDDAKASENDYKNREYPYLDLSNITGMNLGRLDKAMQKQYRFDDGIKTMSRWIKDNSDKIVGVETSTSTFTRDGEKRSQPLIEYWLKDKEGFLHSIPKLAYDNWIGFKKSEDAKEIASEFAIPVSEADDPSFDDWFAKVTFKRNNNAVLPDGEKVIGKKTNTDFFKKIYNRKFGKKEENKLVGGRADKKTIEQIAKEQDVNQFYAYAQLKKGVKHEMEHTKDEAVAKEIAMDHLSEDLDYYDKLKNMEREMEDPFRINSSSITDTELASLCERADRENKQIHATVADEDVDRYKKMGFKVNYPPTA